MAGDLTLAEQLFLAALEPGGKVARQARQFLQYGVAGALLVDLDDAGRIDVLDGRVLVRDAGSTGDPLLDAALELIAGSSKERPARKWVDRLRYMHHAVAERLADRGLVELSDRRLLGVLRRVRRRPTDDGPAELRELIRQAVAGHGLDPSTRSLVGLARAIGLLDAIMPWRARSQARRRAEDLVEGDPVVEAVATMVQSMQDAAATGAVAGGTSGG